MPRFEITSPDGRRFEISAPEGATREQAIAYAQQRFSMKPAAAPESGPDPSEGGGTLQLGPLDTGIPTSQGVERFLAGMGAGMSHMGRGMGQLVGLSDQASIDEAARLEKPLQDTGAGFAGDLAGRIALLAPSAFIPGANTMAGAAAIGAGTGALTTEGGIGDRAASAGIGGVAGPAGLAIGRGISAAAQGGMAAFVDPFTRAGQDRIAARTLSRFAGGEQEAARAAAALRQNPALPPGVQPTAGELSGNAGIAQLESALRQNPELAQAFTERLGANRGAMIQAVDQLGGDDAAMRAATQARDAASGDLYGSATRANYAVDGQLQNLLSRPAMQQAMRRAQNIAENQGRRFSFAPSVADNPLYTGSGAAPRTMGNSAQVTGQGLQDLKMAVDDMLSDPASGIVGAEAATVRQLRAQLLEWMETANPDFRAAREAFRDGSRPINQMQIGQEMRNRLVPALSDFGNETRTTAATFANALRNSDDMVQRATGRPNLTLENTMDPAQIEALENAAQQLGRRANADELGRIPGSNTAQNLVSQNILRQVLGPLGLPESLAENTMAQTLMRPAQFVGRLGEPRVLNTLAEALLNPQRAAQLLSSPASQNAQALAQVLGQMGRVGGATSTGSATTPTALSFQLGRPETTQLVPARY